jgi:hypothetical protein
MYANTLQIIIFLCIYRVQKQCQVDKQYEYFLLFVMKVIVFQNVRFIVV